MAIAPPVEQAGGLVTVAESALVSDPASPAIDSPAEETQAPKPLPAIAATAEPPAAATTAQAERFLFVPLERLLGARALRRLALVTGLLYLAVWFLPWALSATGGPTMSWDLLSEDGGFVSSAFLGLYPLLAGLAVTGVGLLPGAPVAVIALLLFGAGLLPFLVGPLIPQSDVLQPFVSGPGLALLGMALLAAALGRLARRRDSTTGRLLLGTGLLVLVIGFVGPQARLDGRPLLGSLFRALGEAPAREVPAVLWQIFGFFTALCAAAGLLRPVAGRDPAAPLVRGLGWFYALYVAITPALLAVGASAIVAEGGAPREGLLGLALGATKGVLLVALALVWLEVALLVLGDGLDRAGSRALAAVRRWRRSRPASVSALAGPAALPWAAFSTGPAFTAAAGPAASTSLVATAERRLQDVQTLLDKGLITSDEYAAKRAQILAEI